MCYWNVALLHAFLVYNMLIFMKLSQFLVRKLFSSAFTLTIRLITNMADTYIQFMYQAQSRHFISILIQYSQYPMS